MAFKQLMNKFSKLVKKKPQPKTLADFVDKPRKLWSEEIAENLAKNWTEEVQELMKYKLKVEYDPKMPLDDTSLSPCHFPPSLPPSLPPYHFPPSLPPCKLKKEEKEGNGKAEEKRIGMARGKRRRKMARSEMANPDHMRWQISI